MDKKTSFFKKPAVQTLLASLIGILVGLLIGYIVLLMINPEGAGEAIRTILMNFLTRHRKATLLKTLGNTLVKMAPLLMCALSVCFCYKVGLFNIGVAGQYVAGAGAALYCALGLQMNWFVSLIAGMLAGALLGVITGALKAYRSVNEVISGIMLNWITLYMVNTLLTRDTIKDSASPYTLSLPRNQPSAVIPELGLAQFFTNNKTVTIAIPLSILTAIILWVVLNKRKTGYELKATGYNPSAAKYAGMREKMNIIKTLAVGGALAGLGAGFMFLSGYMQWSVTQTTVPAMGFNGIAATFLGGLNPIGTIFASFFIQNITDGGALIDRRIYPTQISDLISAIIIYSCGFSGYVRAMIAKRISRKKEQANTNADKGGE